MKYSQHPPVFQYKRMKSVAQGNLIRDWDTGKPIDDQDGYSGECLVYQSNGDRVLYSTKPTDYGREWTAIIPSDYS